MNFLFSGSRLSRVLIVAWRHLYSPFSSESCVGHLVFDLIEGAHSRDHLLSISFIFDQPDLLLQIVVGYDGAVARLYLPLVQQIVNSASLLHLIIHTISSYFLFWGLWEGSFSIM